MKREQFWSKSIVQTNSFSCSYPEIVLLILSDGSDAIVGERIGIVELIPEDFEIITIIPVESIISTEPHEAIVVLENTSHGIIRKAFVDI